VFIEAAVVLPPQQLHVSIPFREFLPRFDGFARPSKSLPLHHLQHRASRRKNHLEFFFRFHHFDLDPVLENPYSPPQTTNARRQEAVERLRS
jgi:hypothetical protein